jgi:superfamily II DNA or RNA helicase
MGKSRVAIEKLVQKKISPKDLLIVVPRLVLIDNWKAEFVKWKHPEYKDATFVTYVSLPKKADKWKFVIFDECHHLSERCREALKSFSIKYSMLLSATVKRELKF